MNISYNWLKRYIPKAPEAEELVDIFNYHLCEVESLEKKPDGDTVFDLKILPNRAHDLLSHQGVARELASLLNIKFIDPTSKYKIPESRKTDLKIEIETNKCRRYMGRIIRNVKVGPSQEWVVKCLESIGQRSINNMVDAANVVMFDCGQPVHVFDLNKINEKLVIRQAKDGEKLITLDNRNWELKSSYMVIADKNETLVVAGIKGGKIAEVEENTKDIILEVANFDPISIRKTAQELNIVTEAKKRFENDLSPELGSFAMLELSALIYEMCPEAVFEDIVDVYPNKQPEKRLSFSVDKVSTILGIDIRTDEVKDILERYNFQYKENNRIFEIIVPVMRLDINIGEDMAEEIGRILGYDKILPKIPKIDFKPKQNTVHAKVIFTREKLLTGGYSEVMNSSFCNDGEVSVLASASDKNFLRTNLTDGLKESLKLNQLNASLLGMPEIKIFEIGTVFKKNGEEIHVAFGDKKEIKEMSLDEYTKSAESFLNGLAGVGDPENQGHERTTPPMKFKMWSLFPFIARDIAVWVPDKVKAEEVAKIIKENAGEMVIRGPELFDEFKKDDKTSYAFRLVFQSYDRTLTDPEINEIMTKITDKIRENNDWQVR